MQLRAALRSDYAPLGAREGARRRGRRRLGGVIAAAAALTALVVAPSSYAASGDAAALGGVPHWNAAAYIIAAAEGDDVTPPVTTASGFDDNWHNTDVTVTFSATDDMSGVAKTEYAVDGGPPTEASGFTIEALADHTNDGAYAITYWSTDASNNAEIPNEGTVRIDTTEPAGTFVLDADAATTLDPDVSADSAVGDGAGDVSGIADMRFSADGSTWSAWTDYGASATVRLTAGGGAKTVKAQYRDKAGNVLELTDSIQLADSTAPVTSRTDTQDLALYYSTPVTITFAATDEAGGSGMTDGYAMTEYQVDAGSWTTGTSATVPVTAGDDSAHTVSFRSTDAAGNTETAKSVSVNIDAVAPSGRITLASGAAYTSSLTVAAESTVTDAHGPLQMRFSVDGTTWTEWAAYAAGSSHTFTGGEGTKTLYAEYKDAAGNVAQITDTIIYAQDPNPTTDTTPPVTTPKGAETLWHNGPVTITFSAVDNTGGSGMSGGAAKTEYRLDSGVWTTGTSVVIPAPADHSNDGLHTVSYRSTDNAGNTETEKSATIRIDTIAPVGGFILAGGAESINTVVVRYDAQVTDASSPLEQRFSSDGKATWTAWAAYSASGSVTIAAGAGLKTVVGQFRDPAGNVLEFSDDIQLIVAPGDTVAPTVAISGVVDKAWYRQSLLIQLNAEDNAGGTGMAYIRYTLDGLPQIYPGGRAVMTVLRDPNDVHVLTYLAMDLAGNGTAPRTMTFTIDTRGPTTLAKAVKGQRYRTVKLPYELLDNLSPKATVTIVIKNSAGRTVKTLRPGTKAVGPTWYAASWKPTARGTYRYYVKATDVAGNPQAKMGNAKVTVR